MSIDRREVVEILKGGEIPATSWIPPGLIGFKEDAGVIFDPFKAKELLEKGLSGRTPPVINLAFNYSIENRIIAENLQEQWRKNLGVRVELDSMEWKAYLSMLEEDPPQLFRLGWGADFPDPDNFMNLFKSTSGNNHTNWQNQGYDRLIEDAAKETEPAIRKMLYDKAQSILLVEDCVIIPLFFSSQVYLVQKNIDGLKINPLDILYFSTLKITDKET